MPDPGSPLHILVLVDRDWTHPQAGGTGANLTGYLKHWLAWGHRVTVITSAYPGATPLERDGNLTVHRRGRLRTAVPSVAWRQWRGLVDDADVALEVVNGIMFFTPLWLRTPCVTLVHHSSRAAVLSSSSAARAGWPRSCWSGCRCGCSTAAARS